jgi:signal transduction histidine kinase
MPAAAFAGASPHGAGIMFAMPQTMQEKSLRGPHFASGLSARLLALTVVFVMLAEVLIYVPSISRFRKEYLEDRIAKAYLATLAVQGIPNRTPGRIIEGSLERDLLEQTGAHAIFLETPGRRVLMLGRETVPAIDLTLDLRAGRTFAGWIAEAFATLSQARNRVLQVMAEEPRGSETTIAIVIDETPLREEMYAYSGRILTLSIIIALITAGLIYLSLQLLMVRPIQQMCDTIIRFRQTPEDESATMPPSDRRDEIGLAQRELAVMQKDLRAALRQKTRLAALGSAVAKINHDLRNTLATATLASDQLSTSDDPEVRRVTPRLYRAIDRAAALCSRTLDFVRDTGPAIRPSTFVLDDLLAELEVRGEEDGGGGNAGGLERLEASGRDLPIEADREQLLRAFSNLALNAAQAGARVLKVDARRENGLVVIDVADDGPGIPEQVRGRLFQPFVAAGRKGGTGLGLVIAREIVHAHGGELALAESGAHGTTFRIDLPARHPR